MTFTVTNPGLMALVQDRGRPRYGHVSVSTSGAFDRVAHRQVNALLGNSPAAASLEVLGGGLALLAHRDNTVAVCGAPADIAIDGQQAAYGRAVRIRAGQTLTVGRPSVGLRTYVGISGGVLADVELGSRSYDALSLLGPAPLEAGDVIEVGQARPVPDADDVPPLARIGDITLNVVLGPRDDWFTAASLRGLLERPWTVDPVSSRIGVRLNGEPLERVRTEEMPSEPAMRGSVQISANGLPIVFGPDHPVTAGYPVAAVVVDADTDKMAQASPGDVVRFRLASRGGSA